MLKRKLLSRKVFEYYLLSLILFGALFVRLYKVRNPVADWHSWRQVDTASVTQTFLDRGIDIMHPKYHDISSIQTGFFNPEGYRFVEFPIFNIFHLGLYKLIPSMGLDTSGRMISIVASLVTAFCLYIIGNFIGGRWVGLLSSFFYSFIPFSIYFTRIILPDPLSTMLAVLSMVLVIQYIKSVKNRYIYLSAISFGMALLVKPFAIFYALPLLIILIWKIGPRALISNIHMWLGLSIAMIPLFLWRAWISQYAVGIPFSKWAFNGDKIRFKPSFWRWIFGERIGRLILGIWGMPLFILGIITKQKNPLLISTLLGMLMYLTIIASANIRHDYYQTFIIPAIALTLGLGFKALWSFNGSSVFISRSIALFCVFLMLGIGLFEIRENYKINHTVIISAGRAADEILPKDALVIAPYNGNTAFLYQTRRWGWPVVDESIDGMISKGADYYISVNVGDADAQNFMKRFKPVVQTPDYVILDLKSSL